MERLINFGTLFYGILCYHEAYFSRVCNNMEYTQNSVLI